MATGLVEFTEPFRTNLDGSFALKERELHVLALADGFSSTEAWQMARGREPDKTAKPGARRNFWRYKNPTERNASFQARLKALMDEKAEITARTPYGEAEWAALQAFRLARLENDLSVMIRAAELLHKIAEHKGGPHDQPAEGAAPAEAASPGRPAARNPLNRRDPSEIRLKMLHKGQKQPETAESG